MNDNMTNQIDRMNLNQLVPALIKRGLTQTASYFAAYRGNEFYTIDSMWIDKSFVERHIGPGQLFRDLECEVLTLIPTVKK